MAKKKHATPSISQEDNAQARQLLENYHQIADELQASAGREQEEAALSAINAMSEGTQFAFLKALAKEHHRDAANIALALNTLSSLKNVRKEAKRCLIQLEGARIYPVRQVAVNPFTVARPRALGSMREDEYFDPFDSDDEDVDLEGLNAQRVVMRFVEEWCDGEYAIAYNLLASDSPLREGLTRQKWVKRRRGWMDEADPDNFKPGYIDQHEPQKAGPGLPTLLATDRPVAQVEIEASWSVEFEDTAPSYTLPELPEPLLIHEETGRHWFWVNYYLIQEEDEWRIHSMSNEFTNALALSAEEVEQRIQEHTRWIEKITQKQQLTGPDELKELKELNEDEADEVKEVDEDEASEVKEVDEANRRMLQVANYNDILIKLEPSNRTLYEQAAQRMLTLNQLERAVVYLELIDERFAERRGENLRQLAEVRRQLSDETLDLFDDERSERWERLAEEALEESLKIEDSVEAHISLAELYIEADRLDEAEAHLLQAQAMATDVADEAHIEMHLGEVATAREQFEEALSHYQRVAELTPDDTNAWTDLAKTYANLDNIAEALANYRHAIELEPDNEDLYYLLSHMYAENEQPTEAIEAIKEGLVAIPDSVILTIYLGTLYLENQDYEEAESLLDKAEQLNPEFGALSMFREILSLGKSLPLPRTVKAPRIVDAPKTANAPNIVEATPETANTPKPFKMSRPKHKKKKRR